MRTLQDHLKLASEMRQRAYAIKKKKMGGKRNPDPSDASDTDAAMMSPTSRMPSMPSPSGGGGGRSAPVATPAPRVPSGGGGSRPVATPAPRVNRA